MARVLGDGELPTTTSFNQLRAERVNLYLQSAQVAIGVVVFTSVGFLI